MTEPVTRTRTDGRPFAIAGLVVSIIGLVVAGLILGPVGALLGFLGYRRGERGMAIAAMVIGGLAFLAALLAGAFLLDAIGGSGR